MCVLLYDGLFFNAQNNLYHRMTHIFMYELFYDHWKKFVVIKTTNNNKYVCVNDDDDELYLGS